MDTFYYDVGYYTLFKISDCGMFPSLPYSVETITDFIDTFNTFKHDQIYRQKAYEIAVSASHCYRMTMYLTSGRICSLKGCSGIGMECPGRWWSHHPWGHSRNNWTWHLVLRSSWRDGDWLNVGLKSSCGSLSYSIYSPLKSQPISLHLLLTSILSLLPFFFMLLLILARLLLSPNKMRT